MINIIVNINNEQYKSVTNNKGDIGIGTPFATTTNVYEIEVTQDSLQSKYERLVELRETYKNVDLNDMRTAEFGGALSTDNLIRVFQRRLRDVLYTTNVPSQVLGNNVDTFFPYVQRWNSFSGNTKAPVGNNPSYLRDLAAARNFIVDPILNDWIQLLSDILNRKTGLSRTPQPVSSSGQVTVAPGPDEFSRTNVARGQITVNILPYQVPATNALLSASKALIQLKTVQFFDESREYKTVLNFGDDQQYLIEAWRQPTNNSASIQLKLTRPIDQPVNEYQSAYIVREFANPVIDVFNLETPEPSDNSLSLRPANMDVGKFAINKQSIRNVTLSTVGLLTGSVGVISGSSISYDDRVFSRWYTADFNSSELNIDFSDYSNFVFFGSAKARLYAFANKLSKIQSYPTNISVSSSNVAERNLALEREYIKRNFDPYEQFLYFASESNAYSAQTFYTENGIEYNATGSWPKTDGVPKSYTEVQGWYATQSAIAERFDEYNPNYLVKHLPTHIQEDSNSSDFITFIEMFGHVMDNIKVYIDQMSNIYSTNPDPFSELTMDQVYEVAKSIGLELPNAFSVESLQSLVSSLYEGTGARSFLAETWKRFIHSSIYLRKLKGSRTGADAVINTFGLNSPLIQVKESTYAVDGNYIKSDELVYALQFTGSVSSSIHVPFVSSSYSASSLQIRFVPNSRTQSSLLTTSGSWGIEIVPHPSTSLKTYFSTRSLAGQNSHYTIVPGTVDYGKIHVVSGSGRTIIASSSYFPLFSETYTHIMLRSESQDITIMQSDGDQLLFQQSASVNLGTLWNSTYVYLGGTGSIKVGNFDGIIDDVRVWGEETTKENFIKQVYDPGAYYGTYYSSSYDKLYVDLSFSQQYASITQSATNESPFSQVVNIQNIPAYGFTTQSYVRILRTIKQYTPIMGASIFSNRKVTVSPPPKFLGSFVDTNGVITLKTNNSIKPLREKIYVGGLDHVQFAVSPTDFVNQTILRSMGDIDTNYLIGSPRKYTADRYPELDKILDFFLKNYNESINVNQYIRFFRNVLKAPSEYMESYVPARSKLTNGVVIESSILDRRRVQVQKAIRVDGSNTRTFINFVSGSGSQYVGAYDFLAEYELESPRDTTIIVNPVMQKIGNVTVTSSLLSTNGGIGMLDANTGKITAGPVGSTNPYSESPTHRKYLQTIGNYLVSSSLSDDKSGIGFVDATFEATTKVVEQSGYPRNPFLGVLYPNSTTYRIPSEVNTQTPMYEIQPVSDFKDVGTTTYFHKPLGVYKFPLFNGNPKEARFNKQSYLAKISIQSGEVDSVAAKELNEIALLSPSALTDYPGRSELTISIKTYTSVQYKGVLNMANIFSLFRINGASGLRIRLYRRQEDRENDSTRDFSILPSPSAGVLFDGILDGSGEVFPYTLIQTENSTVYFTVDNVTTNPITSTIQLTYFEYEPLNLVPTGYLPRHFKLTRTNNIATRRRNYLGCRHVYCPEGCPPDVTDASGIPPVSIQFTPRTSAETTDENAGTPDRTLPGNDVIKTGGGGPLK